MHSFRGDNNSWLTRALFLEQYLYGWGDILQERKDQGTERVLYTLKDQDVTKGDKTYLSLYRLYMAALDPTEYDFANAHLGGWDHWQRLLECPWFEEYITRWRTELELKLKAKAYREIINEAEAGTKNSFSANKWLIANGWINKQTEPNRRGRPSKQDILTQAREIAHEDSRVQEDLKRLNLN